MSRSKLDLDQRLLWPAGEEVNQVYRVARWLHANVVGCNLNMLLAYGLADEIKGMQHYWLGLFNARSDGRLKAHPQHRAIRVWKYLRPKSRHNKKQDDRRYCKVAKDDGPSTLQNKLQQPLIAAP